jgi:hypothetical protein
VKTGRDRIEQDPDQQVQGAIRIVFAKFAALQSVRPVRHRARDPWRALSGLGFFLIVIPAPSAVACETRISIRVLYSESSNC